MRMVSRSLQGAMVIAGLFASMASGVAATSVQGSVGGRSYTAVVPAGAPPAGGFPVVMVLHGGGGSGDRVAKQTGFANYVDRRKFIAVFPDAGGQQWNDGRETTRGAGSDVNFLVQVAQQVTANGGDPRRVFVTGVSSGGMMAQRLACEAADTFAAAAIVNANMPAGIARSCRPARSLPIVFFSSPNDPLMPWDGGSIRAGMMRGAGGTVISTPQTVDFWARVNGCGGEKVSQLPDRANDGTSVRLHSFSCSGGSTVLYEIDGGGHTWPGSAGGQRPMLQRIVGPTSQDINATATILDFFGRYGL